MQRRREETLGAVLGLYLRESGLETPLAQWRVCQGWQQAVERLVGPIPRTRSQALGVRCQQLWVRCPSPALRGELMMRRGELVRALNALVGGTVITDIRFE